MSRRAEIVVLLGAGALILALIGVNVLAAQGRFESRGDGPRAAAPATTEEDGDRTTREPTSSEPAEEEPAATATEPDTAPTQTEAFPTETTVATTTAERPASPPRLVLTAARGDCYLAVRRGSGSGEVLYEAILAQGGSVDFTGARLWIRIGASTNLNATLDGEPLDLPAGTVDVVVTRAGVQPA